MKKRKIKLNRLAAIVVIAALFGTLTACSGSFKVWQFNNEESVRSRGSAATEGTIDFSYEALPNDAFKVFVSPDGDNNNDGSSSEKAVYSIKQAQIIIRDYVAAGGDKDCAIILGDGEYFLSGGMRITSADVAEGKRLFIRALNNGKATISGSKTVDNSKITETADENLGRVWKIPCENKINQLFVDDEYAIRARYPDRGEQLRLLNYDETMKKIIIDSKDIENFNVEDFSGSTFVAEIMWAESYLRVQEVENKGRVSDVIIESSDIGVFSRTTPQHRERQSFHFENSYAFLSEGGEFWYSSSEKAVYYLPRDCENLDETVIRIPYTEELITVKGTTSERVSNVYFEGLKFKYSGNANIDGKIGNQANKNDGESKRFVGTVNDGRPYSAITVEYADNINFIGNVFACTGGGALDLVEGANNIKINKNLFRSIGGNGILSGATNYDINIVKTDESSFIKNINVENNYFTDIAWQEYGGCAVTLNYCVNGKVSANTINNTTYSAISVGWGWSDAAYPFLKDNEISYNRISNAVSLMSDGSAIYLVGCQPRSEVFGNYIENVYNSVWKYPDIYDGGHIRWALSGIYLDEGVGGTNPFNKVRVYDNYIYGGNVDEYFTANAKQGHFDIKKAKDSDRDRIKNAAGADKTVFGEILGTSRLFGFYVSSAERITVFGESLKSEESVLVLKDKNGKFTQLKSTDIVNFTEDKIVFDTANYSSGEAYMLGKNGKSSNRLYLTLNVDEQYSKYGRFEEEWGGLSGLARLLTKQLDLKVGTFTSSSALEGWPPESINDNNLSTGWSSADGDPNPWIAFGLDGMSKVNKFIIYARAGFDQPECRKNFEIYGYDKDGTEYLLYSISGDDEAFGVDGMLMVDVGASEHKDVIFRSFKICRPIGDDTYFFIAEVAIL